jgi:hypothetical protein
MNINRRKLKETNPQETIRLCKEVLAIWPLFKGSEVAEKLDVTHQYLRDCFKFENELFSAAQNEALSNIIEERDELRRAAGLTGGT